MMGCKDEGNEVVPVRGSISYSYHGDFFMSGGEACRLFM
jgi:hypothetical protein